MRGIGKTQIALKHADQHEEEYEHLIFIDCENIGTFKTSLTEIKYTSVGKKDLYSLLLEGEKSLIIFDHVDDEELAIEIHSLLDQIPQQKNCHVIITGGYDYTFQNPIDVGKVTLYDGIAIVRATLKNDASLELFEDLTTEDKEELISELLYGNPLAIRSFARVLKTFGVACEQGDWWNILSRKLDILAKIMDDRQG